MEKEKDFYNDVYNGENAYNLSPLQSVYFPMWQKVLSLIDKTERIADFGCGVGQFAKLAAMGGHRIVYAVDFSDIAIQKAKINNTGWHDFFHVADLRQLSTYLFKEYEVAVILEVLEHIMDDLFVIANIPENKRIIMSVPSYDSVSHVRTFNSVENFIDRYRKYVQFFNVVKMPFVNSENCIFIADCVRIKG